MLTRCGTRGLIEKPVLQANAYLFSDKLVALVAALFEARERGFYSEEDWRR